MHRRREETHRLLAANTTEPPLIAIITIEEPVEEASLRSYMYSQPSTGLPHCLLQHLPASVFKYLRTPLSFFNSTYMLARDLRSNLLCGILKLFTFVSRIVIDCCCCFWLGGFARLDSLDSLDAYASLALTRVVSTAGVDCDHSIMPTKKPNAKIAYKAYSYS